MPDRVKLCRLSRSEEKEKRLRTYRLLSISFSYYFFILQPLSRRSPVSYQPPPARATTTQKADDKTPTVASKATEIQFNEEDVSIDELRTKLAALRLKERSEERRVVLLDASAETGYQTYYSVMAAITAADGVIGIMTEDD